MQGFSYCFGGQFVIGSLFAVALLDERHAALVDHMVKCIQEKRLASQPNVG